MSRISIILLTGLLIGGSCVIVSSSHALELQALLDAPSRYDGRHVRVTGKASEPRYNESRGKPFTVFDLTDGAGRTVRIFGWEHLSLHEGDFVAVEGIFVKAKQIGRHTIRNEVEARSVRILSERH
jgi:hypothetical protein